MYYYKIDWLYAQALAFTRGLPVGSLATEIESRYSDRGEKQNWRISRDICAIPTPDNREHID